MKILQIHNTYKQKGGEDVVFNAEGRLLLEHGHDVKTLVFSNKNITTFYDKLMAGIRSLFSFKSARLLRESIASFKPDIIHVHNFFPLASPSIFYVAAKHKIPIVLTLHNYRLLCPSAYLFFDNKIYEKSLDKVFPLDAVLNGVYRSSKIQTFSVAIMTAIHNIIGTWKNKITKYIALTEFSKNLFVNSTLKIPAHKIVVKPNFVPDYGKGYPVRESHFLFIGRLSSEKGINTLIEASNLYPFKIVIIGDGPMRLMVEQAITTNKNISYLGLKNKDEVISELYKCKALVFPSQWYEGMPMTILEAFCTGTPVIAPDLGSMSEMIHHRQNGLLFKSGDIYDFVDRIILMDTHPYLSGYLGFNARETYESKYTPEINYDLLIDIYDQLLTHKPVLA
jgi:glycosyltransferase involved in cell wall biosynthesis